MICTVPGVHKKGDDKGRSFRNANIYAQYAKRGFEQYVHCSRRPISEWLIIHDLEVSAQIGRHPPRFRASPGPARMLGDCFWPVVSPAYAHALGTPAYPHGIHFPVMSLLFIESIPMARTWVRRELSNQGPHSIAAQVPGPFAAAS